MTRQRGFTLIEMVLVIIIISVASVPLFNLFTQATTSLIGNESMQTATQLVQERAEFLLSSRRSQGFGAATVAVAPPFIENLAAPYAGFTRTTTITQPLIPPNGCPAGGACKQVDINVSQSGQVLAQTTFVLVNY